jgi:hypothetical protein
MGILENPATNQLLLFHSAHTTNNNPNPDPLHPQLMAEMDAFGFPQQVSVRGIQIRNLSITNGSGSGALRTDISPNERMIDFELNNLTLVNQFTNVNGFWAIVLAGASRLVATVHINLEANAVPANGNREVVYKGTILLYTGIRFLPLPLAANHKKVKVISNSCLECVPGGAFSLSSQINGITFPGLTLNATNFTFMPSISGVAVNNPFRSIFTLDMVSVFNPLTETWTNNQSSMNNFASAQPFTSGGQNFSNERHTDWTTNNTQFFIDQVLPPFRYERLTSSNNLNPISFLSSSETYNFGKNTTDRVGATTIFGTFLINKDLEVGYHNSPNSFLGDLPVQGSHFELRTRSASCDGALLINNFGTIEVGDNTVSNTANFILSNGTTLNMRPNSVIKIADNSSLVIEEGALLNVFDNSSIHLEGPNSRIVVHGRIRVEGSSTLKVTRGSASQSGYLHLFVNDLNQGELFSGTTGMNIDIVGASVYNEVLRIEGGTLTVPANFDDFQVSQGKVNLVKGSTNGTTGHIEVHSPMTANHMRISSIGNGAVTPNGLTTFGQSGVHLNNLFIDNLRTGWIAKNKDNGNHPVIANVKIRECEKAMMFEHLGTSSLENVSIHNCFIGIELNSHASGTIANCNFSNVYTEGLFVVNATVTNQIHILLDNNTFNNCQLGINNTANNLNTTSTTLKCNQFNFNALAIKTADKLNMSKTALYNGFVGGDNSIYECQAGIELNGNEFTMSNGENNFYGIGTATTYNFIHGSVDVASINTTNNTIDFSNNYWYPVPSSGNINSTGNSYCDIVSIAYFSGPYPTTLVITPTGGLLPQVNTTCFTVPTGGGQSGGGGNEGQRNYLLDEIKSEAKLAPNPTSDQTVLTINSMAPLSTKFSLVDAFGKVIKTNDWLLREGVNNYTIDLGDYPTGVYFIRISANNQLLDVKKIVKINR